MNGDVEKFAVEYECSFDGSANRCFNGKNLTEHMKNTMDKINILDLEEFSTFHKHDRFIRIFELPIYGHQYVIGGDSATYTEDSIHDATCLQILDVTDFPIVQVGKISVSDGLHYLEVAPILYFFLVLYNNACFVGENNEGACRKWIS